MAWVGARVAGLGTAAGAGAGAGGAPPPPLQQQQQQQLRRRQGRRASVQDQLCRLPQLRAQLDRAWRAGARLPAEPGQPLPLCRLLRSLRR